MFWTSHYVSAHAQSAEKLVEKELLGMSVSELEEAVQVIPHKKPIVIVLLTA